MSQKYEKWIKPHFYGTIYDENEEDAAIRVLNDGAATNGRLVKRFEKAFSDYVGGDFGVATNSWGGAAQILTLCMGLKSDDEIVIPAIAMSATANFFASAGAKIVFAEVDSKTLNIDVNDLSKKITPKTKAVVVVHMCGQPVDLDKVVSITNEHNISLIQDAAHAPGALYKEKPIASYGDYVLYSFHQAKNMSTLGEGGMVVCNDVVMYEKIKKMRAHGAGEYIGVSNRMTEIQAAIGLEQLKKLDGFNNKRRKLAHYLSKRLNNIKGIRCPIELEDVYHVYHLFNILIDEKELGVPRDELRKRLWNRHHIMTISYEPTINCLSAYKKLGHYVGECPVSENITKSSLILPIAPWYELTDMELLYNAILDVIV